jgi:hypothetical protein
MGHEQRLAYDETCPSLFKEHKTLFDSLGKTLCMLYKRLPNAIERTVLLGYADAF